MKSTVRYHQEQKEFRVLVEKTFPNLLKSREKRDRVSFNEQLLKIVPEIRKYINKRLITAIKKGHFSKGKYKADDFIDQLFIEVYDRIEEVENETDFYLWLFRKTNELLEDTIVEEEFDDFFFQNIDNYSKPEWDEMVENFSTDGDGDLMMIEELDDNSYNKNDYVLNHVFIENHEKDLTRKIDKALSEEDINRHINMVLHNLPLAMRNAFDLFTNQGFTLEEVASIRNCSAKEAEKLLKDARKALQLSLFNR
jgi:RNA polymerase sigma factor (sigma-70 family)